jgi:PPOX class probable F420-dependent enzyme
MTATAEAPGQPITAQIPATHADLFAGTAHGVVTTMSRLGQPHSAVVWVDYDGANALINTTLERATGRNLADNGRISLVVVDPYDTSRFVAIRGDAELTMDGAVEHADELARRYTSHAHFYGGVCPLERELQETRVIVRVRALRVTLDAIHR